MPKMKNETASEASRLRLCWAHDFFYDGNAFGFSVMNRKTYEALVKYAGVEMDSEAEIAFHVFPSHIFKPFEGKKNVLYWAWEHREIPEFHLEGLRKADLVIGSARFLVDVVKQYLPGKPVDFCYPGVDVDTFSFVSRDTQPGRFRFLWVGAANERKGYRTVLEAWQYFAKNPHVELYLKTTVMGNMKGMGEGELKRVGNAIWDSRSVDVDELAAIYRSANCFVFPSRGEGFGFTMAEAMATGLPVIYTPATSLPEIADPSCGYPVKYSWQESPQYKHDPIKTTWAVADSTNVVERMLDVLHDYPKALRKGRLAAKKIRERFTWEKCAEILIGILHAVRNH